MRLYSFISLVSCGFLFAACTSNEPSDSSNDTTSSTGGETSSTGDSTTGAGGGGGAGGSTTGASGAGGMGPTGPCKNVPADTDAVIFTAPSPHAVGLVGISGWIECPQGSGAVCTGVSYSDPFPGCVAASGDTVMCLLGSRPKDAKIRYIAALYPADNAPANSWFSTSDGVNATRYGTHVVCVGTEVVGGFDGTSFSGALAPSDEPMKPQNYQFTIP